MLTVLITDREGVIYYGDYPFTEIEFLPEMKVRKLGNVIVIGYTKDERYWVGEPVSNFGSLVEILLDKSKELTVSVNLHPMG